MQCRHFPDPDKGNNRLNNLQWGTRQQNKADEVIHGTINRGTKQHKAKLTEKKVLRIVKLKRRGWRIKELSERFNVHKVTIFDILSGKNWYWLTKIPQRKRNQCQHL